MSQGREPDNHRETYQQRRSPPRRRAPHPGTPRTNTTTPGRAPQRPPPNRNSPGNPKSNGRGPHNQQPQRPVQQLPSQPKAQTRDTINNSAQPTGSTQQRQATNKQPQYQERDGEARTASNTISPKAKPKIKAKSRTTPQPTPDKPKAKTDTEAGPAEKQCTSNSHI